MSQIATYVDHTGKPPAAPEALRLESVDAVKLAKFFVALGFTAEKQATPEGRQYILAKANGVQLSIIPSRAPKAADDWNMTLMVDDVAAAVSRAEAAGGSVTSPIKEISGGRKCVLASSEGHRVVLAERRAAAAKSLNTERVTAVSKSGAAVRTADDPPQAGGEFGFLGPAAGAGGTVATDSPERISVKKKTAASGRRPANSPASASVAPASFAASPQTAKLFRAVRISCGITAAGLFIPMFGGVVLYSTMGTLGSSTKDVEFGWLLFGGLCAAGTIAGMVAKGICLKTKDELVDSRPVKSALKCEVAALVVALLALLAGDDVFVVPLLVVSIASLAAAPVLFVKYLGRIAEGVGDQALIASYQRAEAWVKLGAQGTVCAAVFGAGVYFFSFDLKAKTMISMVFVALAAFASCVTYLTLLVSFATNKTLKAIIESGEVSTSDASV